MQLCAMCVYNESSTKRFQVLFLWKDLSTIARDTSNIDDISPKILCPSELK